MAIQHFPDGVKIGPDAGGTDRLPIYDADEWSANLQIGELAAGESAVLTMENVPNMRPGQTIFAARPMNPDNPYHNFEHLLVVRAYIDASDATKAHILVRNMHSSAVEFGEDQWTISHLNTAAPPPPPEE